MNCKLTLGEKLKDLRTSSGMSLIELEKATGILILSHFQRKIRILPWHMNKTRIIIVPFSLLAQCSIFLYPTYAKLCKNTIWVNLW